MKSNYLDRCLKFSAYCQKPIIFIENLFGDNINYWFVVDNWKEFNPSSHIHFNELKGKCISNMVEDSSNYDQIMFLTKYDEIETCTIKFSNLISWVLIK